jgi:hypothetical protein
MFNDGNECGTGAVVPWAGRLWVITYSPHEPNGSSDKLYEITPTLDRIERPESVGGTPANRFIHRESSQLLIGPYVIDPQRKVRVIPPQRMPGRLTGIAPHLTAPESTVYYATMEEGFYDVDAASVPYVDERGRWRLPKGDPALDQAGPLSESRVCREVCTERDLFNAHGTFYELPAENAGGFAKIRPSATHNRLVHDYASFRGLLVLSGLSDPPSAANPHVVRSDDGKCALWVGAVDHLWELGKPRGTGGPWKDSAVEPGRPSDPDLMTGYDRKSLTLGHTADSPVGMTAEVDLTGDGDWVVYRTFRVPPHQKVDHRFPDAFSAYWVRLVADRSCQATAQFAYE